MGYNVSTMNSVGIRELRLRFSEYLSHVRRGETLVVTDRGKPIARLEPVLSPELTPRLQRLIEAGRATYTPAVRRHVPTPVRMLPGEKTAVDYVIEQRR